MTQADRQQRQEQAAILRLWHPKDDLEETTDSPHPPPTGKVHARMTLTQFFERWYLPVVLRGDKDASQSTIKLYRDALARWTEFTGDPQLTQVDDFTISQFQEALRTATYKRGPTSQPRTISKSTQKKHLAHIKFLLYRVGPAWDPKRKTAAVLAAPLHITVNAPAIKRKPRFTLEQARKILAAAREMRKPTLPQSPPCLYWRAFLGLLFYTGLRSGTVLRLEWQHVVDRDDGPWLEVPEELIPKTHKQTDVPLHPLALKACEPFRGGKTLLPKTHCYRYLAELHEQLQQLAGVSRDKPLGYQAWRRTQASEIARLGAKHGEEVARRSLDHSDAKTTNDHYSDLYPYLVRRLPALWEETQHDPEQMRLFD